MLERLDQLRHRIVGRTLLYVVLPTIVIFAISVTLASRSGFRNLRRAAEEQLQLQAKLVALQIEDLNSSAVISVERMAEAQVAGMFGDRQASLDFARSVLDGFEGININGVAGQAIWK